jgi:hypothetical protein
MTGLVDEPARIAVCSGFAGHPTERKWLASKNLTLGVGPLTIETRRFYLFYPD